MARGCSLVRVEEHEFDTVALRQFASQSDETTDAGQEHGVTTYDPQHLTPLSRGRESAPFEEPVYSQLRRERILWLAGEVRDDMANKLCGELLLLAAEDPDKDIYLYVNSPGGSVSAGMAIYDTMQFVKNDVVTVGMGMAASMGQFLLTSGASGKRYALPNLRVMMHQPLGGLGGVQSLVAKQAEQMVLIKKQMAELIAHHTGQPFDKIVEDSEWEKWFSAQEAKDYGIVDHVVTSAADVAGDGGTA